MISWRAILLTYAVLMYLAGLVTVALYAFGIYAIRRGGRTGPFKFTSPEPPKPLSHYLGTLLLYWILSPILVPWWWFYLWNKE